MSTPLRVLILEDQPADAELMLRELRRAGFEPDWTRVVSEADYLAQLPGDYDVILADHTLPQFDALRALRLLQERSIDIPLVVVTGSISEEAAVASIKQGAADYLLKDRLARLGPAVVQALEQKHLRDEKRQAEEALRANEKRFRALIENSADAIALIRADGTILYESPAASRILGYAIDELVGRNAFELVHPDDRPETTTLFARLLEKPGTSLNGQFRLRHQDGAWPWIEASGTNLLGEPSVQAIVVNYRDITRRKQAEQKLRLSDEILQRVGSLILVADTQGHITYISPSVKTILGYEPSDLLGDGWWKRSRDDPVEWEREKSYLARCASGEIPLNEEPYERLVKRRDGERRWIVWQDAKGPAATIIGVGYDITERKQRERELEAIALMASALRAARSRADMLPVILNQVRALLNVEGVALVMRRATDDDEMVVTLARGAWADWTGIRIVPGEGLSGHIIAQASSRPYLNNDVQTDARLTRSDRIGDLRAVACVPLIAEEQTIGVLGVGRKIEITDNELSLLTAIADIAANALHRAQVMETLERRVTERTRALAEANERLTELDRLKSKFVADVSHELRTPVANLKLYAALLERGQPEKRARYIRTLTEQSDRLAQLVEDILNLSRLELGADKVRFAPVDLNALVEQVVLAHQASAESAGLRLTFAPGRDLPPLQGERNQLAQVITNLVANAISYTPAGEVYVRTDLKSEQVCLQVRDTGMGIDPEDVPHLFERFYRGKQTGQSDIPGSGLGLAIVKEIVDLHQGHVEVDSQVGQGSTFRVWLPLAQQGA